MVVERYTEWVDRLRRAVLETGAVTAPALRRAIEAYAARAGGRPGPAPVVVGMDEELRYYVDTVSRYAYRIRDDDVSALRRAGHTEDAVFEVTVSAALGSGLGRLERGYAALRGEL